MLCIMDIFQFLSLTPGQECPLMESSLDVLYAMWAPFGSLNSLCSRGHGRDHVQVLSETNPYGRRPKGRLTIRQG